MPRGSTGPELDPTVFSGSFGETRDAPIHLFFFLLQIVMSLMIESLHRPYHLVNT